MGDADYKARPPRPEPLDLLPLFLKLAGVPKPWTSKDTLRDFGLEKEFSQFARVTLLAHDLVSAHQDGASDKWKDWLRLTTWNETAMTRVVFLNILRNAREAYVAGHHAGAVQQVLVESTHLGVAGLELLEPDVIERELKAFRGEGYTAAARLSLSVGAFGDVVEHRKRKVSDVRKLRGGAAEKQGIRFEEVVADRFRHAEKDTEKPPKGDR